MNLTQYKDKVTSAGFDEETTDALIDISFEEHDGVIYIDSRDVAALLQRGNSEVSNSIRKIIKGWKDKNTQSSFKMGDVGAFQFQIAPEVFERHYLNIEDNHLRPFYMVDIDVALQVLEDFSNLEYIENVCDLITKGFILYNEVIKTESLPNIYQTLQSIIKTLNRHEALLNKLNSSIN